MAKTTANPTIEQIEALRSYLTAAKRPGSGGLMTHIRARMPRKGGNSFYRDKNDYTKFAVTLCGAPVTDKDIDYATANTKKFRKTWVPCCAVCLNRQDDLQAAVLAALPDAFPRTQSGDEHAIISADRPVEYGTLDGNTIKVRS